MEHKHGCIVLHHGKIMSTGYNYNKVQHRNIFCKNISCSTHAEMSAILSLKGKKADTLIVVRVGKDGSLRDSKPCKYCYEFIYKIGIRKIFYSLDNDDITYVKTSLLDCTKLKISRSNQILMNMLTAATRQIRPAASCRSVPAA
jgi:deoxycytidylate deaminase